jgi:glutathione S-transferase
MRLYIGNKNYSSWSLRPWLLMKQLGIAFEEHTLHFDDFAADSVFKRTLAELTPVGTVPLLIDGELRIWESIAIVEYLADCFPELNVWPRERTHRALARRACAEMHAGFSALRTRCPMNIELDVPGLGERLFHEHPALARDVARICQLWEDALRYSAGPFLYGEFSAADAFYAPVATRIRSYRLPVSAEASAYVARIYALSAMNEWVDGALAEHTPVARSELYRPELARP